MWRKSFDWTRSSNKRKCDQFFSSHLKALIKMLNTTHFQQFASFEWSVRSWLTASDFTPTCSADSVCAAKTLTRLTEQIHCAQRFCLFYQLKWKSIKCSLNANTQNKQNPALRPKSTRCLHAVAYIHMYGCSLTRIKYHLSFSTCAVSAEFFFTACIRPRHCVSAGYTLTYPGNRTRSVEVCKSWASPPSGSSHTALWCPEAVETESLTPLKGKWTHKEWSTVASWNHSSCTSLHTHQAFDNLQQLLHHHSNALVAQQSAHHLNVWGAQKVSIGAKSAAIGQVQGLHAEKDIKRHQKG